MRNTRNNPTAGRSRRKGARPKSTPRYQKKDNPAVRLNKYIANAGVCSRREADVLITNGAIKVNGEIVTELGTKVLPGDVVTYGDEKLVNERKVYVLLNKPKDYITTTDDPYERKTVMQLVGKSIQERLYPVGRLDRNTTGLLLLTNDGTLAKKLSHPSHGVKKLYHVKLNKGVKKEDMDRIANGISIGKDEIVPDTIAYANPENKSEIGIEIHSGQNRVVRRIFEQLGYKVVKLDRVMYAGLTKKDLPRGKWRNLTEKEIIYLKMTR